MQRLLSALVLIAFSLVAQMPFVHALDMGAGHEMVSPVDLHSQATVLCDKDGAGPTQSCFTEIPESKWVQSMEKVIVVTVLIASFFALIFHLSVGILSSYIRAFFRRRILYYETLYLGLYGIVRSVR